MKTHRVFGLIVGLISLLILAPALAQDCGCQDTCGDCYVCEVNDGTGDYIEIGVVVNDITGDEASYQTLGVYPEDWYTSGRVHFPDNYCPSAERFEVRWQDISAETGRAMARIALYPVTLGLSGYMVESYAWNQYSSLSLQEQEMDYYDAKLRLHRGELDNMSLTYESRTFDRDGSVPLMEYSYNRLGYKYNFDMAGDRIRGSFRQVATAIDAPRTGTTSGEIDSSILKLKADLSDDISLRGKGVYTNYNYENLPDEEFQGTDFSFGMDYRPDCDWEISADYRTKDNPTDNSIASHVDAYDSYGTTVTWLPGCGNRIQAGWEHRDIDYVRLNVQDSAVRTAIRGSAQLTQADIASGTTSLTPEYDEYWTGIHWNLTDRLTTDTRLSFTDGTTPGTDLVTAGSSSLFYDERLNKLTNWYYTLTDRDQVAFLYSGVESSNTLRGNDFDMDYYEGSWTRCTGGENYLTLGLSATEASLDNEGILDEYTSKDTTYLAAYNGSCPCFDYGLDFALTDGTGTEVYEQLAFGADIKVKRLGPVALRFDWFDRQYDNNAAFDTEAMEVGMTYTIDF